MKFTTLLALSAPLLVACKPMAHERFHHHEHKRGNQVTTSTTTIWEEVTVTVDVYVTINVPPPNRPDSKGADIHLDKPNPVPAVPTTTAPPPPVVQQEPPKVTPPPAPQTTPPPPPTPQQEQLPPPPQQKEAPPPAPVQPVQPYTAPAPQQPAPQQPAPYTNPGGTGSSGSGGSGGGSGPTGGSCGEVGGKCMASDVTIYNDQGIGACGWTNDTNSQDYFALSKDQWGGFTNDAPGPHKNQLCGRMATISVNGKEFSGMLTDKCPGCSGWSIDLSLSLWNKVYNHEAPTRKNNVQWWFTGPAVYSPY